MLAAQPIRLLLFLPVKYASSHVNSAIKTCPHCGYNLSVFNKTSSNNDSPKHTDTTDSSVTNSASLLNNSGWFCHKCKTHLLLDKRSRYASTSSGVMTSLRDSTMSTEESQNSRIHTSTTQPPTQPPPPPPTAAPATPQQYSTTHHHHHPSQNITQQSSSPQESQTSNKESLQSITSNQGSTAQSQQSPHSTSFTEQYDEWENQVTSEFRELLSRTRDHVLSREKVLKAHQVDLCQREKMLKSREEQVNEKLTRLQESEESLKEKLDRLNMYKDVMLSQIEAKARQLIKIEKRIQDTKLSSNEEQPIYQNTNGTAYHQHRNQSDHRGISEESNRSQTRSYSLYPHHQQNGRPPQIQAAEHHFTVLPPVTVPQNRPAMQKHETDNVVDYRNGRLRQRPHAGQRHRSTSAGALRRRHRDTSSRDSLLSDGASSVPASSMAAGKIGISRPKSTQPVVTSDNDLDSGIRSRNASMDTLDDPRSPAQHYANDIINGLDEDVRLANRNGVYRNGSGSVDNLDDQKAANVANQPTNNATNAQVSHVYIRDAKDNVKYYSQDNPNKPMQHRHNRSSNPGDDQEHYRHSRQSADTDTHVTHNGTTARHMGPHGNHVTFSSDTHAQHYNTRPLQDQDGRSMSYRYNVPGAATSHKVATRERKHRYSYHGYDQARDPDVAKHRGRSMDPSQLQSDIHDPSRLPATTQGPTVNHRIHNSSHMQPEPRTDSQPGMGAAGHSRNDSVYTSASSELTTSDRGRPPGYEESLRNMRGYYRATEI